MSPDDTLRTLLRDAADDAPAYEPIDVDAVPPASRIRRWTVLGLVAAAVAVIVAGGVVLGSAHHDADVAPPVGITSGPSQPTPTDDADDARCPAEDFTVTWSSNQLGADSEAQWFTVTNTSRDICPVAVTGPSEIEGVTAGGETASIPVQSAGLNSHRMAPAHRLNPGESGRFVLGTGERTRCDEPLSGDYAAVSIDLGARSPLLADFSGIPGGSFSPGCGVWVSGVGVKRTPATVTGLAEATVKALDGYLKMWQHEGYAKASARYLEPQYQVSPGAKGMVRLRSGEILSQKVWSRTGDSVMLMVELDLHFVGDAGGWNDGANTRFVTGSRATPTSPVRLAFATGP